MLDLAQQQQQPKYGIFTHSVGYHTAGHSLLHKLRAISQAGLDGVEIFSDDLYQFAQSDEFQHILNHGVSSSSSSSSTDCTSDLLTPPDSPLSKNRRLHCQGPPSPSVSENSNTFTPQTLQTTYNAYGPCTPEEAQRELQAAHYISWYCSTLNLEIYNLQPLRDIEGWVSEADRKDAMQRVCSRFPIMEALGTDLLLICSNNVGAPRTTGDLDHLVRDFQHISDLATQYTTETGHYIKVGFEALSWGAHVEVWNQAWQVVKHTDRDNIGLILDSFNTLGREYADPCSESGILEPATSTYRNLMANLDLLSRCVPANKIFFLQIGDAKRMASPLPPSPNTEEPKPSRMIWSRSSRLFPCEDAQGAFLPVKEFILAVSKTGYNGIWSIEVFNDSLTDHNPTVPSHHATRARAGLDRLFEQIARAEEEQKQSI